MNDAHPIKPHCMVLGARMREHRLRLGLSQVQMSQRCGLARSFLWRIEDGRVNATLWTIVRLADALDVTPADLVGDMTFRDPAPPASDDDGSGQPGRG